MFKLLPHLPSSPALAAQSVCDCGCRLNPGALKKKRQQEQRTQLLRPPLHLPNTQKLRSIFEFFNMCLYLGGMRSSNWKFYWNGTSRSKSGNYSRWAYSAFISCSKNMNYFIINSHTTAMSTDSKTWTIWYAISTQLHQAFEQQTSHLDRIRKAMRVQRVTSGIRRTLRINLRAVSAMVY